MRTGSARPPRRRPSDVGLLLPVVANDATDDRDASEDAEDFFHF